MSKMDPLRLRLKFDDPSVLSDSQRFDGLKRSWFLVEPRHHTISDVVSHLLHSFHLSRSCPTGLLLSMDGFVLPPFQSTAILKDKDLVCVKRKKSELFDVIKDCGVKQKHVQMLPPMPGDPLLANEEFEEETGGFQVREHQVEPQNAFLHDDRKPNGDVSAKKRKLSESLKDSKGKRRRENVDNSSEKEVADSSLQNEGCQKKSSLCNRDQEHKLGDTGKNLRDAKCTSDEVFSGFNQNREGTIIPSCLPDGTVRGSVCRSTWRKKVKRWKKSQCIAEKEQMIKNHLQAEDLNADVASKEQNLDAEDPPNELNKENEVPQDEEAKGSFNWHGISNKKQGKKWGMDKESSYKRNKKKAPYEKEKVSKGNEDASPLETQSTCTWDKYISPEERQSGSRWTDRGTCSRNWATQQVRQANASMDYEKLVPLTDIPVQGDTIAYRLLEISSSFCAELTAYRVGKVSWFDQETNRVMLIPVPEYPFEFKKAVDDTSEELPNASHYNKDGLLEIDFPSLVDVRIVKLSGDLNPGAALHHVANGTPPPVLKPTSGSGWRTETPVKRKSPPSQARSTGNDWTGSNASHAHADNGNKDVWEEMSAALSAKNAELLKEDNWNKKQKYLSGLWLQRALRSRPRSPTMALLRAQHRRQTN